MAKTTYNKLGLKKIDSTTSFKWKGKDDIELEINVKNYLPLEKKIALVEEVLNSTISDDKSFINEIQKEVLTVLNIIFYYTDVEFTEKQKENIYSLYDNLLSSGFVEAVSSIIPEEEIMQINHWVDAMVSNYYKYQTSALGILEKVTTDYKDLDLDAEALSSKIKDPENLTLLKNIVEFDNSL